MINGDKDILCCLFRVLFVMCKAQTCVEDLVLIQFNQVPECVLVPLDKSFYQLIFIQTGCTVAVGFILNYTAILITII